jgi:hypothetical protein
MNVWFRFCEQLATNSWKQSMASQTNKPQLQDLFITLSKISTIGDKQSRPIFISRSVKQEMAKKWKWSRRWQIWVAYLKIGCKPRDISKIERRNTKARGGGAKNTITINI